MMMMMTMMMNDNNNHIVGRFIHVLLKSDFWTSGCCLSILKTIPITTSLAATVLTVVQLIVQDKGIYFFYHHHHHHHHWLLSSSLLFLPIVISYSLIRFSLFDGRSFLHSLNCLPRSWEWKDSDGEHDECARSIWSCWIYDFI